MKELVRITWLLSALVFLLAPAARAQAIPELTKLSSEDSSEVAKAVDAIAARHDTVALEVLSALLEGTLRIDVTGTPYSAGKGDSLAALAPGSAAKPTPPLSTPLVNNQLRRQLEPTIAALKLGSNERQVRLSAAEDLAKSRNDELAPLVRKALAGEHDAKIRERLQIALAQVDLASRDKARRLSAIAAVKTAADANFKPDLERLTARDERGQFREPDEDVRRAASAALGAIETAEFDKPSQALYELGLAGYDIARVYDDSPAGQHRLLGSGAEVRLKRAYVDNANLTRRVMILQPTLAGVLNDLATARRELAHLQAEHRRLLGPRTASNRGVDR